MKQTGKKPSKKMLTQKLGYSFLEAAAATSLSRRTLEYLIQQRKLEAVKIGRRTVILARSLERLFHEKEKSPAGNRA